jgi:hypothetical protein
VAPVERGPHRLLAIRAAATAVSEKIELLPEARSHLLRAQGAQACRGQLNGEGQARQLRADTGQRRRIAVVDPKTRPHVAAALHQEPDGVVLGQPGG